MRHSKWFERIREWYKSESWSFNMVKNAVVKNKITKTEFKEITGKDYE